MTRLLAWGLTGAVALVFLLVGCCLIVGARADEQRARLERMYRMAARPR